MVSLIKKRFSSIAFKLFLSFWLFAILTIVLARFVATQFTEDNVLLAVNKNDFKRLSLISERIAKRPRVNINRVVADNHQFKGSSFILKNIETNEIQAARKRYLPPLIAYLEKNNLASPVTIQFVHSRLTGPVPVNLNDKPYQLFIAVNKPNPNAHPLILKLPQWSRILIPIIVSAFLAWLLARSLVKPILALKSAAAKIGDGHLSTRIDISAVTRKDELGELSQSFDQMATKLEQNINAHQRLLADVSHELRSPMTRLQMAIGLAQQSKDNKEALSKHLERCELEVSRLDDMIAEVLSLSRLENTIQKANLSLLNLSELLSHIVNDCQFLANDKAITINTQISDKCIIEGDSNLLTSAITNVITNAIKYSNDNAKIDVTLALNDKEVSIAVKDYGEGVPEEKLPLLFNAFYRVSDARDRETGGTGLGLAIAKQAVLAHKGIITAANNTNKGLTVSITLPV